MATIYIDGEPRQVDGTQNLLHVLLSLGYDLPYFAGTRRWDQSEHADSVP